MYSSAIWTAERCGDAKTAIFLLSSMRRNGCTPNAISYDGGERFSLFTMIFPIDHFGSTSILFYHFQFCLLWHPSGNSKKLARYSG